jgi:hypothetical protein
MSLFAISSIYVDSQAMAGLLQVNDGPASPMQFAQVGGDMISVYAIRDSVGGTLVMRINVPADFGDRDIVTLCESVSECFIYRDSSLGSHTYSAYIDAPWTNFASMGISMGIIDASLQVHDGVGYAFAH